MNKIYLITLCIFTSFFSFSQIIAEDYQDSQSDKVSEFSITIEPYKKLSNGAFFTSLTLVSDNPYVEYVKGFDFECGYRYQLKVKETIYANPPQDVSDRDYELIEVALQTLAYQDFEMILINEFYLSEPRGESITKLKAGLYRYHDEMEFYLPPVLRADFDRKMKKKAYCKGKFSFQEDGSINLLKLK